MLETRGTRSEHEIALHGAPRVGRTQDSAQRGELKQMADFPAVAPVRTHPGQAARLRLDGFPRSTVS